MGKLAAFFPLGAKNDRTEMYLAHRRIKQTDTRDLTEAVERLCVTRVEKSFPTLGALLQVCGDAAGDRRGAEKANRQQGDPHRGRLPTEDELDQCKKIRDLGRIGVFYCDVCCEFVQAEKVGLNGWNQCHYAESREMWRLGTDGRVTREAIHAAWAEFVPSGRVPRSKPAKVEGFSSLGEAMGEAPF
jgi:hypothetical protein